MVWKPSGDSSDPPAGLVAPIEVRPDCPVVLDELLLPVDPVAPQAARSLIVEIDGWQVSEGALSELPGVRVGAGEGCGYVFQRPLDGKLVFVADVDYAGVSAFSYRVASAGGEQPLAWAVVDVRGNDDDGGEGEIMFAGGSQATMVTEGIDAAILGALSLPYIDGAGWPSTFVFEGEAETRSSRFEVSGDRLRACGPLNAELDGTIRLRIVAFDAECEIASGNVQVEVRAASGAAQTASPAHGMAADQFLFTVIEAGAADEATPDGSDACSEVADPSGVEGDSGSEPSGLPQAQSVPSDGLVDQTVDTIAKPCGDALMDDIF